MIPVVASVLVGVAFLVAGASKIALRAAWPEQARGLGAPSFVIPILPWIEIVVGALLIAQVASPWAALAALALLCGFTALILLRLAQGSRPPCACFGAWSAKPIGAGNVWRNLALMALSAISLA